MSYSAQNLVWNLDLRPSSCKFVLLALAMRAGNESGECFPSVAKISADTGLDRKTIMAAILKLESLDLLTVTRLRGAGNKYSINLNTLQKSSAENGTSTAIGTSTKNGTPPVPKTGLDQYQKRDTNLSITYQEPVNKKSAPKTTPKAQTKKRTLPDDFVLSDKHRAWAEKNDIRNLEGHYEYFCDAAGAKGYEYADWDRAFQNAMRSDWAKLNTGLSKKSTKVAGVYAA